MTGCKRNSVLFIDRRSILLKSLVQKTTLYRNVKNVKMKKKKTCSLLRTILYGMITKPLNIIFLFLLRTALYSRTKKRKGSNQDCRGMVSPSVTAWQVTNSRWSPSSSSLLRSEEEASEPQVITDSGICPSSLSLLFTSLVVAYRIYWSAQNNTFLQFSTISIFNPEQPLKKINKKNPEQPFRRLAPFLYRL